MAKGFIYILRNGAMPGLLKVGYSVKVPTERIEELFTTGVPEPFEIAYYCLVEEADKLECMIHEKLAAHRHHKDREFFRIDLATVVQTIESLSKPEHVWREERSRHWPDTYAGPLMCPKCKTTYQHRSVCTVCQIPLVMTQGRETLEPQAQTASSPAGGL